MIIWKLLCIFMTILSAVLRLDYKKTYRTRTSRLLDFFQRILDGFIGSQGSIFLEYFLTNFLFYITVIFYNEHVAGV